MTTEQKIREFTDFLTEFGNALDRFGDQYRAEHGKPVDGYFLMRALTRWLAAAISGAPADQHQQLLIQTIAQLHTDLDSVEDMITVVPSKRDLN